MEIPIGVRQEVNTADSRVESGTEATCSVLGIFFRFFFHPRTGNTTQHCSRYIIVFMAETTKFYGNPICPFAHRAWWAAKEKGVPLEFVHIPLGDEKPEWYVVASLPW